MGSTTEELPKKVSEPVAVDTSAKSVPAVRNVDLPVIEEDDAEPAEMMDAVDTLDEVPVFIETSGGYIEVAVSEENLVDIENLEANSNDPEPEETDDPNYNTPAKGPSARQPPLVIHGTPALASPPKTYF